MVLGISLGACTNLEAYRATDGDPFSGIVLGVDEGTACGSETPCSFLRRGFTEGTALSLTFDPEAAEPVEGLEDTPVGRLTTSSETCAAVFDGTPYYAIPPLVHDRLTQFEFPGARTQNYLFALRPDAGPLSDRDAMLFLSLLPNGDMEVRIIAGTGRRICAPGDCAARDAGECDYFGVFRLEQGDRE